MKNKTIKKMMAAALSAVMLAGTLTGCKVAVSDEKKEETTEQTAESGEIVKYGKELTNLDLDGTLKGQYEGKSITVPVSSGDFEKAVNAYVPLFEELTGAEVVVESIPGDQLTDKIQLDLNNTHNYDVILAPIAFLHSYASADKVADLAELIKEHASEGYDMDDFLPGLFETYGYYEGELVAIPYKPDVELLFYRKDLFEDQANKDAYQEKYGTELKVPQTNEELFQVAEFFTKSKNPESPVDYGYSTNMLKGTTRLLFYNRGGDDIDENLKPNMNNEAGIQAMNHVLKLQEYAPAEWMQMGWDEANQFFANGNSAMMEQWPGLWLTCQGEGSAVKGKIGVAVAPGQTPVLGGWGAGVAAESDEQELAWKFIEFMTSKDGELLKIENTMDPCRTSTYEIEGVASSSELYGALMDSLNYAKTLADVDVPYISSKLCDVMETYIQDAMKGTITVEQALENMEKDFNTEIEQVVQE